MDDNIQTENCFNELVAFLREQIREYKMPITRETLIEDGLGITGEEANNLIVAFSKKYNVDINNFNFEKYFYDEPGFFNSNNKEIEALTAGHLEKGIIAGRLDEEVINN